MLKIRHSAVSTTGTYHLSRGKTNEDSMKFLENDIIAAAVVADGCSSSAFAQAASEATCKGAAAFAQDMRIWDMQIRDIKTQFLDYIDQAYFATDHPYGELLSTVAVLVINKISGQYLSISIGDSSILIIDESLKEPNILNEPLNLLEKESTVFANANAASVSMKCHRGSTEHVGGFTLITDGAGILQNSTSSETLIGLAALTIADAAVAEAQLKELIEEDIQPDTQDDITVLQISLETPETYAAAKQLYPELMNDAEGEGEPSTESPDTEAEGECPDMTDTTDAEEAFPEASCPTEDTNEKPSFVNCIEETEDWQLMEEMEEEGYAPPLLDFLSVPRSLDELVAEGFASDSEILVFLRPFLADGLIGYENRSFFRV